MKKPKTKVRSALFNIEDEEWHRFRAILLKKGMPISKWIVEKMKQEKP